MYDSTLILFFAFILNAFFKTWPYYRLCTLVLNSTLLLLPGPFQHLYKATKDIISTASTTSAFI